MLKFRKIIVIVKIMIVVSAKLHNFGTSKIIFYGSNFFCRQEDFPFFCLRGRFRQSEIKFLKKSYISVSLEMSDDTNPPRSLCNMLIWKLEPVDNLLGGDSILEIELAQELFDL